MLRTHAQIYGGGTFNINPGRIKRVPILDASLLTHQQREALRQSYLQYLSDENHSRLPIDDLVYDILELSTQKRQKINETLKDLLQLAISAKKVHKATND